MTSGGFEKIIPMVVGILVFAGSLAVMVSMVLPNVAPDPALLPPGESAMPSYGGTAWLPAIGHNITWWNITNCYWNQGFLAHGEAQETGKSQFTDPAYSTHKADVRIIMHNNLYDPTSTDIHKKYENFMSIDGYHYEQGWAFDVWYRSVPFETIISNQDLSRNISITDLNCYGLSLTVRGRDANVTNFTANLYTANYSIFITQQMNMSDMDFLSVVVSIVTFNTAWMSGNEFIAIMISIVVDVSLLLAGIRLFQGFIP